MQRVWTGEACLKDWGKTRSDAPNGGDCQWKSLCRCSFVLASQVRSRPRSSCPRCRRSHWCRAWCWTWGKFSPAQSCCCMPRRELPDPCSEFGNSHTKSCCTHLPRILTRNWIQNLGWKFWLAWKKWRELPPFPQPRTLEWSRGTKTFPLQIFLVQSLNLFTVMKLSLWWQSWPLAHSQSLNKLTDACIHMLM